ncbi:pilus assembly protein [Buttiauxella sp. B2]|uniref:fimbrial protein n=1 Tax=Buttiauxella sp. B2 TaxID=2587812 RepID=UPI0011238163|nr:fimbrial protein [Buttiauxella sp. B2]TNV10780.1 pilus assembly protein [Buttiauxella sp. B2]
MLNLKSAMIMLFSLVSFFAFSADNTSDISLHGTLIEPPPCYINGGEAIAVRFGDHVGINKVDGLNYKQTIDYGVVCDDDFADPSWVLGLTVKGTSTSFDEAAVQMQIDGSTQQDLGAKILLGGKDFPLNKRVEINQGSLPVMESVPVKAPGATLPDGYFHATATLMADYE